LEVAGPKKAPESVVVSQTPFLIGRGSDTGNHLVLEDPPNLAAVRGHSGGCRWPPGFSQFPTLDAFYEDQRH